jgi:hypothetical protein
MEGGDRLSVLEIATYYPDFYWALRYHLGVDAIHGRLFWTRVGCFATKTKIKIQIRLLKKRGLREMDFRTPTGQPIASSTTPTGPRVGGGYYAAHPHQLLPRNLLAEFDLIYEYERAQEQQDSEDARSHLKRSRGKWIDSNE